MSEPTQPTNTTTERSVSTRRFGHEATPETRRNCKLIAEDFFNDALLEFQLEPNGDIERRALKAFGHAMDSMIDGPPPVKNSLDLIGRLNGGRATFEHYLNQNRLQAESPVAHRSATHAQLAAKYDYVIAQTIHHMWGERDAPTVKAEAGIDATTAQVDKVTSALQAVVARNQAILER